MRGQLDIGRFLSLKKQELGTEAEGNDLMVKLEVSTQSIHHRLQYCQYHYDQLLQAAKETDLMLDRISVYRRAGEIVPVRYVYEANIVAFLHSLHALLDSFLYLLNLFMQKGGKTESTHTSWSVNFIKNFENMDFYDELEAFSMDLTFNKMKGYVNTIKHKHIIRISNRWDHLEFEQYTYERPYLNEKGEVKRLKEVVPGENIVLFIKECHDELIPKLFKLCESILQFKERQLAKDL